MQTNVNSSELIKFQKNFGGEAILPADKIYSEARKIFNSMIDYRPALIAQCKKVEDIIQAIRFARENGLESGRWSWCFGQGFNGWRPGN